MRTLLDTACTKINWVRILALQNGFLLFVNLLLILWFGSLGIIVTSFQDFKSLKKRISPTFSYFLINNALLYHFLVNWLAHNKKMTDKSVFHELSFNQVLKWRRNRSQFPVFGLAVLYPTGRDILRFWYFKTRGKKIAIE